MVYGATGNGSTDDTAAIQACVTAAAGSRVVLPAGTYLISSPITLSPYTIMEGEARETTIIRMAPGSASNFSSNFMINGRTGPATDCAVKHLTLDGNYANLSPRPASSGGLLECQNGWTVEDVEFQTTNYFKCFVNGVSNVLIRDCVFTGTTGAGNDCIGGGGSTYVTVERCRWVTGVNGNGFDHVNGQYHRITGNYFTSNVYLEGVTDSTVEDNTCIGGAVIVQSNSGYNPATLNMPKSVTVSGNRLYSGGYIHVKYGSYSGAATIVRGGNNTVIGNVVDTPANGGILIDGQVRLQ